MTTGHDPNDIKGEILVVDDEVPNLQLLTRLLSGAGYSVRPARGLRFLTGVRRCLRGLLSRTAGSRNRSRALAPSGNSDPELRPGTPTQPRGTDSNWFPYRAEVMVP